MIINKVESDTRSRTRDADPNVCTTPHVKRGRERKKRVVPAITKERKWMHHKGMFPLAEATEDLCNNKKRKNIADEDSIEEEEEEEGVKGSDVGVRDFRNK